MTAAWALALPDVHLADFQATIPVVRPKETETTTAEQAEQGSKP